MLLLLPCRERGSKTTKEWLRKLQRFLHYAKGSYKDAANRKKFKLITVFTCRARELLATLDTELIEGLEGIISFEPRPIPGAPDGQLNPVTLASPEKLKQVEYCDRRSLNTMQLARLGRKLTRQHGGKRLSIVYTYSKAAASAMKLLSSLILGGKMDAVGAAPTASVDTALDDAEAHANAFESEAVLYIGGPPNPDKTCPTSRVFGKVLHETITNTTIDYTLNTEDCDCRQWAFQFLRPRSTTLAPRPEVVYTPPSTLKPNNVIEDAPADVNIVRDDTVEDYEVPTEQYDLLPTTSEFLVSQEETTTEELLESTTTTTFRRRKPEKRRKISDEVSMVQDGCFKRSDSDKLWLIVTIIVTSFGLMTVAIGTMVLMLSVKRANTTLLKHEFLMPMGILILFISTSLLAVNRETMALCVVKRILPGLGYTLTFIGMLLQVFFDLDKNVYTVNPKNIKNFEICCGLTGQSLSSKETGQFLVGLCMAGVEVIVLVVWFLVQPTNLVTGDQNGCQMCRASLNLQSFAIYSFAFPLLIGILVCAYSMLSSLRWKINSGGASKCNVFAILVCGVCWSCLAIPDVQDLAPDADVYLVSHLVSNMVLLLFVFTQRVVARIRHLIIQNEEQGKELQMTGNSLIPEFPSSGPSALTQAALDLASIDSRDEEEEEVVVVKPSNGTLSMRAANNLALHSHVNRSYTNTYSSCGSFKLPSVIGMHILPRLQEKNIL